MLLFFLFFFLSQHQVDAAVARFSVTNTGISGTVTISNRQVIVNLNVSKVNTTKLPSNCFEDGLRYHVHTKWTYDDTNDRIGSTACGTDYTGGHWDPWVACSDATANTYCKSSKQSSSYKCVTSSSAYSSSGHYLCNQTSFGTNPFACEVSDLDGKYGRLYSSNSGQTYFRADVSFWEMTSADVLGKAIVFHCGSSGSRAFCAPFVNSSSNINIPPITQFKDNVEAKFEKLSKDSKIELNNNGGYSVNVNLTKVKETLMCDHVTYRIYDSWDNNNDTETSYIGNKACSKVIGKVYDPTVTCLPKSDSKFCDKYAHLCNDTSYMYQCDSTSNRYTCSPSDLSGKYGALLTQNLSQLYFSFSGSDDLMIPLSLLVTHPKSIALECSTNLSIIACAKITLAPKNSNVTDNSLSVVVILIIVVFSIFGAAAIAVFFYLWCRKITPSTTGYEEENIPLKSKQQSL